MKNLFLLANHHDMITTGPCMLLIKEGIAHRRSHRRTDLLFKVARLFQCHILEEVYDGKLLECIVI